MIKNIHNYQLHKQNLQTPAKNYSTILSQHIALHSTDYLTPYLSAWARTQEFDPAQLFNDLNNQNAVRLRAMRGTLFVANRHWAQLLRAASPLYLGARLKEAERMVGKAGLDLPSLSKQIVALLQDKHQLTSSEIKKALGNAAAAGQIFTAVLRHMEFGGIICRPGQRYITDPVVRYGLTSEWFPDILDNAPSSEIALKDILQQYISQFGPVCLDDICWWFPITKTLARTQLEVLQNDLQQLESYDQAYYMTMADWHAFQEFTLDSTEPQVHFLPYEDHFPKAYIVRDWFLSQHVIKAVFHVGKITWGELRPTIWLNDKIIGRWEWQWADAKKSAIELNIVAVGEVKRSVKSLIEAKRLSVEQFMNDRLLPLMKK